MNNRTITELTVERSNKRLSWFGGIRYTCTLKTSTETFYGFGATARISVRDAYYKLGSKVAEEIFPTKREATSVVARIKEGDV